MLQLFDTLDWLGCFSFSKSLFPAPSFPLHFRRRRSCSRDVTLVSSHPHFISSGGKRRRRRVGSRRLPRVTLSARTRIYFPSSLEEKLLRRCSIPLNGDASFSLSLSVLQRKVHANLIVIKCRRGRSERTSTRPSEDSFVRGGDGRTEGKEEGRKEGSQQPASLAAAVAAGLPYQERWHCSPRPTSLVYIYNVFKNRIKLA